MVVSGCACTMLATLGVLAGAGCSGKRPRAIEDARRPLAAGDATAADAADDGGGRAPAAPSGDAQIRVTWTDVPPVARTSPGKTACGTPRAPAVTPTTTWGIPEALVVLDGAAPPTHDVRVRLADCALEPRLVVGSRLIVDSALDRPARLELRAAGSSAALRALDGAGDARPIQLPIAGHAVSVALPAGTVSELRVPGPAPVSAWVVAGPGAVTDASGVAMFRDVPVGTYTVRAWLPPRGGQPARHAAGELVVADGDLAELALELAP